MRFLVDAQLPPLLSDWINDTTRHAAKHVRSLEKGLLSTDSTIWETALQSNETIIKKDLDFFDRTLVSDKPPLVCHINLGNCSNKLLLDYISNNWNTILNVFENNYTLVSCSSDDIEYW